MSKSKHNTNTVVKFKFLLERGFRLGNSEQTGKTWGNFVPANGFINKPFPGMAGNAWVQGADLSHVFEIELESEIVRGLPGHIANDADESIRNAYRVEQAKEASEAHRRNNAIRDELAHYSDLGIIEVISDSFLDEQKVYADEEPVKKMGRPKKEEVV
jgi:hypothetical protein